MLLPLYQRLLTSGGLQSALEGVTHFLSVLPAKEASRYLRLGGGGGAEAKGKRENAGGDAAGEQWVAQYAAIFLTQVGCRSVVLVR